MLSESLRREIGQHFVVGFHGQEVNDDIRRLIQTYFVGSVILMKRNVKDVGQVRRIVSELQMIAKEAGHERALLIGTDQENGMVSAMSSSTAATQFPGAMALAASGSKEMARDVYAASGKELRLLGVNWAYSPVADVNSDMKNPVIGVRSFGDDAEEVAKYVVAAAQGLTSANIAPAAKHFPGHGDTHVDSHLALPRISKSREDMELTELIPFRRVIEEKCATIMTGHMALPLVTGGDIPCSLSRQITTGWLRGDLGFEGVVVTDCLEMDAIAELSQGGCGIEEGAVRALEAGADIAMICHTMARQVGAIERVYDAVQAGRISANDLKDSGDRVKALKDWFADWSLPADDWNTVKAASKRLSEEAYQKTITILQNGTWLKATDTVVCYTPRPESLNKAIDDADGVLRDGAGKIRNTAGPSFAALAESISKRTKCVHVVYPSDEQVDWNGVSGIVFVLRNADRSPWQLEWMKKAAGRKTNMVLVSCCTPYDLNRVSVEHACLATFEFTAPAFEAAVGVIFGEAVAEGYCPVIT
ncbi:glycoside hydrolase family 3 protein [Guyanagaster necrorhizus]|uniref:Glycoside hydrolase family 3 protein n=1 Tax=Guyanagaster necrorhizus TaxID=856835 RepID=A0A9P8ATB7_9AGAR|nr:glycoside hydrolase family 3 protein [Guyanagaster necrorhizus MCA 3950]KAG7447273.1 glycoside hydrolase family 3 protein [Guyanagaster necrorhizus MCA 3950]